MDDGEVDLSSQLMMSNTAEMSESLDEMLHSSTRTCTHTHTCNPPGPSAAHTHTCYHTHTQVLSSGDGDEPKKPRKPRGNREAVRKYREKKKAHAAYLEEEVKKLRLMNQQLVTRLQGQAALEAEVVRLRTLLVDLRVRIDGELGAFPYQKQCNAPGLRCSGGDTPCGGGNSEIIGWEGSCVPAVVDSPINPNGQIGHDFETVDGVNLMGAVGSLVMSASQAE